jgi:hypothetical protein
LPGTQVSWVFPITINEAAEGTYCVRTTNDNGTHIDTSATTKFVVTAPPTPLPTPTPEPTIEAEPKNPETTVLLSTEPTVKSARRTLIPPERKIKKNIKQKSRGNDVRVLQKFLNANGFELDETGPRSNGKETPYFGPLTQAALLIFQSEFGFEGGDGELGPRTRAFINAIPAQ